MKRLFILVTEYLPYSQLFSGLLNTLVPSEEDC